MEYFNSAGKLIVLGRELGKGGAARVFCNSSNPNLALKIFHDHIIEKEQNLTFRLKKLVELTKVADFTLKIGPEVRYLGSFPQDLILDKSKKVVGYQMERIQDGIELSEIVDGRDPSRAFQSIKLKKKNDKLYNQYHSQFLYDVKHTIYNRFVLCRNLALAFSKLYTPILNGGNSMDVKIWNFDIKPQNILIYTLPISDKFAIIPYILDLDNITLKTKTQKLSPISPQFTPHYRAPEGQLDEYYDYFSIAVIFYQLIFDTHPFTVRGESRFRDGDTADYYISNYCFAWGKNRRFLSNETKCDWRHNNFSLISSNLQSLFIRAFDSDNRTSRPSPLEWGSELGAYLKDHGAKLNNLFKTS